MRPIFPWTGTKRHIARMILKDISPDHVIEPFAGGAATFFRAERPGTLVDINHRLTLIYAMLRDRCDGFVQAVTRHIDSDSEAHYYETRHLINRGVGGSLFLAAASMYILLAGRNGLWRVDKDGHLNTPYGNRGRLSFSADHMRKASALLRQSIIIEGNWTLALAHVQKDDLVYFDPPYSTGFNSYHEQPFTLSQWETLAECARDLRSRHIRVAVSNYDDERVNALFTGWRSTRMTIVRRHNPLHPLPTVEILFQSYL